MTKSEATALILKAKKAKKLTWETIAFAADLSPVFCTSACLGQNSLLPENADKLATALDLPDEVSESLQEFPV